MLCPGERPGKARFFGGKMANDRIRVRLRGFDVELVEQSAMSIVQTVVKAGAKVSGPVPLQPASTRSPFSSLRS